MATPVEVPKLGNTVEECIITKWYKRKGDRVSSGDLVAEIETDKTTFEVNAPVEGTLLDTFFDEGAIVPVFTNLFVIGSPGENADAFRPEPSAPAQKLESTPVATAAAISPRAQRFAREHGVDTAGIVGSGPGGR